MEQIERYIDAVVRYLPPRQRPDITRELRSLIEDMLQQRTGSRETQPADIEAVLLELGDPRILADNYRGTDRCLISPPFFDLYWLVLRIALVAAGGGVLLAMILEMAANPPADAWLAIARIFGSIFNALITAFGMVTLIFALNDRFNDQGREELAKIKGKWHPSQLPPRTVSGLLIKRAEPIVALIFMVIALIIINTNINRIGLYVSNSTSTTVTPLFSNIFQLFLPWLNLSIGLAIILEGIKLITGRWNLPLVIGSLVQKTLGLIITLRMFADAKIFNPEFFQEINRVFNTTQVQMPPAIAPRFAKAVIIIAIVGYAIDFLSTGWKGLRLLFHLTDSNPPADSKK